MFILPGHLPAKIVIAITLDPTIRQLLFKQLPTLIPNQLLTAVIRIPNLRQLPVFVVAVGSRISVRIGPANDIALITPLILPNRFTTPHNPYEPIVMLVGRRLILPRKQRHQASSVVVLIRRHRPQRVLLNRQPAFFIVGFKVLGTVRIHPLHQPRPLIMHVDFLAAVGVKHRDLPVVIPGIPRVHLRKAGPMPHTPRRLASPFPLPKEARPTGQTTLKNDVLFVVPINLAFTDSIGRRNQSPSTVIRVGNNVLFRYPDKRLKTRGPMDLIIHRHDPPRRITQKQRTPDTVIQPLNLPQIIAGNAQPVVIRIADRRQHTVAKVVEP
ncbi:hypothetical protein ALQ29_05539 [Pseudomonas marginalis pv. marginalis]|uniref:Uncharacterized protein n=1 Tax=Pseudomonas marginalis pv. marginalis TaxID=97473 RepID=A0A3M4AZC5_PSEMA|nr:hypothetical protein ALQ38_05582 [Pseudomonas marginalis pv. marginalis]RMP11594.1 hypothetical protein ALQ29_05539 [Pseudomonas marginalis pv. marginalis]